MSRYAVPIYIPTIAEQTNTGTRTGRNETRGYIWMETSIWMYVSRRNIKFSHDALRIPRSWLNCWPCHHQCRRRPWLIVKIRGQQIIRTTQILLLPSSSVSSLSFTSPSSVDSNDDDDDDDDDDNDNDDDDDDGDRNIDSHYRQQWEALFSKSSLNNNNDTSTTTSSSNNNHEGDDLYDSIGSPSEEISIVPPPVMTPLHTDGTTYSRLLPMIHYSLKEVQPTINVPPPPVRWVLPHMSMRPMLRVCRYESSRHIFFIFNETGVDGIEVTSSFLLTISVSNRYPFISISSFLQRG